MEPPPSFFNWSLKRLLITECDAFEKAKAKILYVILTFSLIKILIAIGFTWHFDQHLQLYRAAVALFIYTLLLKLLLVNKKYLNTITHCLACLGLLIIWSNTFLYSQNINILTIQFIFMLILSSFYLLKIRFALLYSTIGTLPVILQMLFQHRMPFNLVLADKLASPGYEILIILNFVTIIISHYLFRQAFIVNMAEKEALNIRLQQAVKEATEAAESKSDFLSTMSHELRTPLNSVIGISELLLNDTHSKEQEENLNILKFSAGNLHTLINDILDFNKLGSGKLDLEHIPVDLTKLFSDISQGLRFQATQKGIDFILNIDDELIGQRIITDPTRITQIIYNLAGNAIKFTDKGSVAINLNLLYKDEEAITVKVWIADTGIGISPEKQQAIFEPFTQASSSTTRNFGGTGLGLAIVKRLLFVFDSAVRVESTPGVGSTFSFELTLLQDMQSESIKSTAIQNDYDLAGMKILVAEDNSMNRILLMKIFSKWNCELIFALNGQEAVDKIAASEFDIVLMDLHMPVMDGYEATRTIRSMTDPVKSNIKIIALTASVSGNLNEKIRAVGMDEFILKPFKLNELYERLKESSLKLGRQNAQSLP